MLLHGDGIAVYAKCAVFLPHEHPAYHLSELPVPALAPAAHSDDFSVLPLPRKHVAVLHAQDPGSVRLVLFEDPLVPAAVGEVQVALSVHHVVPPLADVDLAVVPVVDAPALSVEFEHLALKHAVFLVVHFQGLEGGGRRRPAA